jgi:hypothetical protein
VPFKNWVLGLGAEYFLRPIHEGLSTPSASSGSNYCGSEEFSAISALPGALNLSNFATFKPALCFTMETFGL